MWFCGQASDIPKLHHVQESLLWVYKNATLAQMMAWHRQGDKSLSEPMMVVFHWLMSFHTSISQMYPMQQLDHSSETWKRTGL